MSSDEKVLRYLAGIIGILAITSIALAEVIRNGAISPGVMAILSGPILLVITLIASRTGNGK